MNCSDKNTDCDSSCLFTLIQAAYERVLPGAPVEKDTTASANHQFPSHMYKDHHEHHTRHHPHGTSDRSSTNNNSNNNNPSAPQGKPPGGTGFHSKFFNEKH